MVRRSNDTLRWGFWLTPGTLRLALAVGAFLLASPPSARAILIIGPNDSNGNPIGGQNTSAPTGSLANSGWDLQGTWQGSFTGTPIAPNYFITARHLGGLVGDTFTVGGQTYTTTQKFEDPSGGDLIIWKVNGTFSNYAPLYTGDEVGQNLITFGRGGPHGGSVTSDGVALNGWLWGPGTTSLSWGTNQVTFAGPVNLGGVTSQFIGFAFDKSLGSNTGSFSAGDSGGGVFINDNGVWKLAGVNSAAESYNTQPGNSPSTAFSASLYDARGLYDDGSTTLITGPNPVPSVDIAARISTEAAWIASVTGVTVPEPGSWALLTCGLALALPAYRRHRNA